MLEWPVDYSACGQCDTLSSLPASGIQSFEDMAGEYLWRWTKQRYGLEESTIRPCRQDSTAGLSTYGRLPGSGSPWTPVLLAGQWSVLGCGSCGFDSCGCSNVRSLVFEKPVAEIVAIEIDGVLVPADSYRVDDNRLLVRQDGGHWPYYQNMSLPLGKDNTWAITVKTGTVVPLGGRLAAGKLACELAKAACGEKNCELPQRWQTISRQGVTISAAIDLFTGLDEGKTGIWLIDSWVASVVKPDTGFSLASPDARKVGRRTTSNGSRDYYGGGY